MPVRRSVPLCVPPSLPPSPASIAARALERLPSTRVVKGDLTDLLSLKEAAEGCQAAIMCR